ncbi:MAG: DUF370 domain-containing protein [Clostridia bacterium]|nr:DUF370 domain-containing protein [Clostridia bacterium]
MFLHIGSDVVARSEDIIGVFDMDNTTISVRDREFLSNAQRCGEVVNICDDLPKSYVVTSYDGKSSVYISSVSTQTIYKRSCSKKLIF